MAVETSQLIIRIVTSAHLKIEGKVVLYHKREANN
jgi:hypothetical protein